MTTSIGLELQYTINSKMLMSEWKDYINVEVLTLIVAVVTLIVSILSYRYMRKSDKRNVHHLINSKKAQLEAIEKMMGLGAVDHSQMGNMMVQQSELKSEIEQLKKQL